MRTYENLGFDQMPTMIINFKKGWHAQQPCGLLCMPNLACTISLNGDCIERYIYFSMGTDASLTLRKGN
jgi:hypothetical protein